MTKKELWDAWRAKREASCSFEWLEADELARRAMTDEEKNAFDTAAEYIGTYIGLQAQVDALQAEMVEAKEQIRTLLYPDGVKPGVNFKYPGLAEIQGTKGRKTVKLDRAVLARGGVSAELLDSATTETEGEPSMRIVAE